MTDTPKSLEQLGRSVTDRLRNQATKLQLPFESLLSYFLLERLTARLVADRTLAGRLVFKGGYVSLRVYRSPRYTTDLDALLKKGTLSAVQKPAVRCVETDLGDGVWFRFEGTQDLATQGEYGGLRLIFRSGIGEPPAKLERARAVHLDIGTGDPVVPAPQETTTPFLLGDGELSWSVYPVETICSEKLHTLLVRGDTNSRSKDVFDLNLLLPQCDPKLLRRALKDTFRYRGDDLPPNLHERAAALDVQRLKTGWRSATASVPNAGTFEDAWTALLAKLVID